VPDRVDGANPVGRSTNPIGANRLGNVLDRCSPRVTNATGNLVPI
jgi:hypothetical protein